MTSDLAHAWKAQGFAFKAFWEGDKSACMQVRHEDGEVHQLPVSIYFREENELPPLEAFALSLCRGKVLDVGAGAGAHSHILEKRGISTSAIDIEHESVKIMQERGIQEVICGDFLDTIFNDQYDTLLMLMNGIGISANMEGLKKHLTHAYQITSTNGQLLLDSSELEVGTSISVSYRLGYGEHWGPEYKWLYLSQKDIIENAQMTGWLAQIIYEEDDGSYLARLIKAL